MFVYDLSDYFIITPTSPLYVNRRLEQRKQYM